MMSFIRLTDIPADELHLLPIRGLRQQIRKDRCRINSPPHRREPDSAAPQGGAQHDGASPAKLPQAAGEQFVTDWQLHDAPPFATRLRFGREGCEDKNRAAAEAIDVLYVEHGGEA
jgi:hypothetical protein